MKILGLPDPANKTAPEPRNEPLTNTKGGHSAHKSNGSNVVHVENLDHVFKQVEQGHEALSKAKKQIEEAEKMLVQVARDFQLSEAKLVGNDFEADVIPKERVTWNTNELENIFREKDKLPAHVKKSLRVDKDAYDKLPKAMKNILEPARIVNPQKPKINVRRK